MVKASSSEVSTETTNEASSSNASSSNASLSNALSSNEQVVTGAQLFATRGTTGKSRGRAKVEVATTVIPEKEPQPLSPAIPKKLKSRKRSRDAMDDDVVVEETKASGLGDLLWTSSDESSDSESESSCSDSEPPKKKHKKTTVKALTSTQRLDMLAKGELPFHAEAKVPSRLKEAARSLKKRWDQMAIKHMHKILTSLLTDMNRKRNHQAADDVESIRAVIEHLQFAAVESPALQPMVDDAAKDIMQVALSHETMPQGSSSLWIVVTKHLLQKVGELASSRHDDSNSKFPSRGKQFHGKDFPGKQMRDNKDAFKKKFCRNCLAARPAQRVHHSLYECQSSGNTCNIDCGYCGECHWESTCRRTSFA